jgi:hypothetical protein
MKMQYNILQRVRQVEEKAGIKYAKADGRLYMTLKVLYIILFAYTMAMNVFYLLGNFLVYFGNENFANVKNSLITVMVASLGLIAALVFAKFKSQIWANITSAILNFVSSLFLVLNFANLLTDDLGFLGYKLSFYWRHSVPLLLIVIFSVWFSVIAVRGIVKTQKQYKKVVENLYEKYNLASENEQLSEEEWEEFLINYKF